MGEGMGDEKRLKAFSPTHDSAPFNLRLLAIYSGYNLLNYQGKGLLNVIVHVGWQ